MQILLAPCCANECGNAYGKRCITHFVGVSPRGLLALSGHWRSAELSSKAGDEHWGRRTYAPQVLSEKLWATFAVARSVRWDHRGAAGLRPQRQRTLDCNVVLASPELPSVEMDPRMGKQLRPGKTLARTAT